MGEGKYFGRPPFEPSPSQYICPPPSIIASGVAVIVTFFPPNVIEPNELEFVNPNVVLPANVTVEFAFNFERSMLPFDGAAISCNMMLVQFATAGAI